MTNPWICPKCGEDLEAWSEDYSDGGTAYIAELRCPTGCDIDRVVAYAYVSTSFTTVDISKALDEPWTCPLCASDLQESILGELSDDEMDYRAHGRCPGCDERIKVHYKYAKHIDGQEEPT